MPNVPTLIIEADNRTLSLGVDERLWHNSASRWDSDATSVLVCLSAGTLCWTLPTILWSYELVSLRHLLASLRDRSCASRAVWNTEIGILLLDLTVTAGGVLTVQIEAADHPAAIYLSFTITSNRSSLPEWIAQIDEILGFYPSFMHL